MNMENSSCISIPCNLSINDVYFTEVINEMYAEWKLLLNMEWREGKWGIFLSLLFSKFERITFTLCFLCIWIERLICTAYFPLEDKKQIWNDK